MRSELIDKFENEIKAIAQREEYRDLDVLLIMVDEGAEPTPILAIGGTMCRLCAERMLEADNILHNIQHKVRNEAIKH